MVLSAGLEVPLRGGALNQGHLPLYNKYLRGQADEPFIELNVLFVAVLYARKLSSKRIGDEYMSQEHDSWLCFVWCGSHIRSDP